MYSDGSNIYTLLLQMWSLEYTQVPIDRKLKRGVEVSSQDKPESTSIEDADNNKADKMSLFKQMKSLSQPEDEHGMFYIYLFLFSHSNLAFLSLEIVKSASESSISEASQHSNESTKSAEATAKSEPRKSSITGAKSLHEMKSATVEAPGCSSDQRTSEGKAEYHCNFVYINLSLTDLNRGAQHSSK